MAAPSLDITLKMIKKKNIASEGNLHAIIGALSIQSDGEKSDQDLIVDDASDPPSPVANGTTSPRENGLDKASSITVPTIGSTGVQTSKRDAVVAPPHSPRSGTSSNASTPSAKKMEDREKPSTPISKPLTPTSGSATVIGTVKTASSASSKLLHQASSVLPGAVPPPTAAYPGALHYPPPGPPPPHNLVPTAHGQHPHVADVIAYNGYATPRPPSTLQMYDPHAAIRTTVGSIGIPGGKP